MASFNEPTNTTLYTQILSTIRSLLASCIKLNPTSDIDLPTDAMRHGTESSNKFQKWNGSAWVDATVNFGSSVGVGIAPATAIGTGYTNLEVNGSTTGVVSISAAGTRHLSINADASAVIFNGLTNRPMVFSTNALERMRITAAGRVGINQGAPSTYLDVVGSDTVSGQANVAAKIGIGTTSDLLLGSLTGNAPFIASQGANPLLLCVNGSQRLRINPTGFVVFNMTTGAGTHTMKYDINSGAWTYDTSSARYKTDIQDSPYGLDAVKALQPRKYKYKEDDRADVGFVAEELHQVIPELAPLDSEGRPDSVMYDRLTSVLCKAIQELSAKVEALEAQLASAPQP